VRAPKLLDGAVRGPGQLKGDVEAAALVGDAARRGVEGRGGRAGELEHSAGPMEASTYIGGRRQICSGK